MNAAASSPDFPLHLGSTYRVQLAGLGFAGAARIVPYLARLGVETMYCSPILQAAPDSTHGYDVVDPTRLDPALGTPDEFESLLGALAAQGMRLLIDIVPNHLAAHLANPWWRDVLRQGQDSPHAAVFDIDWSAHHGRVLLPTLGHPLAEVLANGEAVVRHHEDVPVLELSGQALPMRPDADLEPTDGPLTAENARALIDAQHYRPAFWRLSATEGNYRRFFDIDGLVGVRVEDPAVFDATHAFLLELAGDERVAGVRADHIDGLAAPSAYLERLRHALRQRRSTEAVVLVEKILARDERLPADWDVDGTTGYEFGDLACGLFVDQEGAAAVQDFMGAPPFGRLALAAKREVLAASFGASLDRLAHLAMRALDCTTPGHDLSPAAVRQALAELTVRLLVYRTYLESGPDADSTRRVRETAAVARPALAAEGARALGAITAGLRSGTPPWDEVVRRWQQLSGAVMAKGVEDTAGYRWPGLLGEAEVGSEPGQPTVSPQAFVDAMAERLRHPLSLNATSTHDSKRSEDVRARLHALSEWGHEWVEQLEIWRSRHRDWSAQRADLGPQAEHLVYQTLVAMWPVDGACGSDLVERIGQYVVKAAREADVRSSWTEPDAAYEDALVDLVRALAGGAADASFPGDARAWAIRLGSAAITTSLSLTVLKAVSPGLPDIYQGNETLTYALTDPDNRRAVDFAALEHTLQSLGDDPDLAALRRDAADGRLKLHVVHRVLTLRRREPALFDRAEVTLLRTEGRHGAHVVGLLRPAPATAAAIAAPSVLAVVPRLTRRLIDAVPGSDFALGPDVWDDTQLVLPPDAPTRFTDELTGRTLSAPDHRLAVADVLAVLPVSVLTGA